MTPVPHNERSPRRDAREEVRTMLVSALVEEVALLDGLRAVFVAQREALAQGDPRALDDGVFAATRVMRTMEEARRSRRRLTASLFGSELDFDELEALLADAPNRPVRRALTAVRTAAAELRSEVAILRRILQVSLADNRRHLDILLGETGGISSAGGELEAGAVLDRVG